MKQRLGYVLVLALATGSFGVSACSGDDSSGDDDTAGSGGAAGSRAGSKTGGSSNKAGANSGGGAASGNGGTPDEGGAAGAGVGGAVDGGMGGVSEGGAVGNAGAAGNGGGEAGAGGAGEPQLVYACGSDTLQKKLCSAFVGANCTDPTVCADCVMERTTELSDFVATFGDAPCASCIDKYQAYFQCAIDAFETANIGFGIECIDGYGADLSFDNCVPLQGQANECHTYLNENECPAMWPPT